MHKPLFIDARSAEHGVTVLRLKGPLDAHTFDVFRTTLEGLIKTGKPRIVVDMNDVEYMSSSGAGLLLTLLPKAQAQKGNIVLLNPTERVHQVLALLGLADLVPIELSQAAAVARFAPAQR